MKIYEMANMPGRIYIETGHPIDPETAVAYAATEINFPELAAFCAANGLSGWHDLEEFCHLEPVPEFPGVSRWVMGTTTTKTVAEETPAEDDALYYERLEMELAGIRYR